jgi:segregation and condensation protein B
MELKFILEALLHTAQKPLSPSELKEILHKAGEEEGTPETAKQLGQATTDAVDAALRALAAEHEAAGRSYRLACVAGSWQFVTSPAYAPWLKAFLGVKPRPSRLTQPALETLAIIAYRQPITRAEMEQIRGVAVDGVIATLRERNLIEEAGRAEVIGRPMQYATTQAFLEYFGLANLNDLPAADELRLIPVQRPQSLLTVDPTLSTTPQAVAQPELPIEALDTSLPAVASPEDTASGIAEGQSASPTEARGYDQPTT